ncbi:hypothetical protein G7K_4497-t1 [Saitoella complicata NRRL Y-17804]|uniref:BD-FAE-like domain-containing protein n=2 Tax=Saitoella complicata (strain BCRC 22490 / CBS 7301 / JCM 7358 / NBRC 10748 / NRRL Y-17804) TaxID=698492 RepID=A0A0E9NLU9_SAICN|nr:hypothetical protein G7K_4497-t1 [Saitoella complicata NRRL Y-17804]
MLLFLITLAYFAFSACTGFAAYLDLWANPGRAITSRIPMSMRFNLLWTMGLISECPIHVLAVKLGVMGLAKMFGVYSQVSRARAYLGLGPYLALAAYATDLASIAIYIYFAYSQITSWQTFAGMPQLKAKDANGEPRTALPSLLSAEMMSQVIAPLFVPSEDTALYPDISYNPRKTLSNNAVKRLVLKTEGLLDVIAPRGRAKKAPVVLWIHGGGWVQGSKEDPYAFPYILARQGIVVVRMNYRKPPSYPLPAALVDVRRALRWIHQQIEAFGGDPEWISIAGDSAGGHLASLAASGLAHLKEEGDDEPEIKLKAAVLICPVTDVTTKANGNLWQDDFPALINSISEANANDKINPYKSLKPDSPSMLLFHGTRDSFVPIEQSYEFVRQYKQKVTEGGKIDFVLVDGTNHFSHCFAGPKSVWQGYAAAAWLEDQWKASKKDA